MPTVIRLLLAVAVSLSAAGPSRGAESKSPVRMAIVPVVGRPRSQAPLTLEISLDNQSTTLIEGELDLVIYVGRRLVQRYRSDPLLPGPNGQTFRITLPPITVHHEQTQVTAVGRFVTAGGEFDLKEHDLPIAAYFKRAFVVAISQPDEHARPDDLYRIESALALERFAPSRDERTDMLTGPQRIDPADFPTTVVGYMSFDIVLLEGRGFTQLRERQLTALADWVDAGGSVLVRAVGNLAPAHVAFLNRLTGDPGHQPYVRSVDGGLDETESLQQPLGRYHCGLGRAVVLHRPRRNEEDFFSREWIDTAAFLWKMRRDQVESIRQRGSWRFDRPPRITTELLRAFAPQEAPVEGPLRGLLIPRDVQGVPLWVVIAILTLFLLVIAPGDYFVLGALRARRYTWFTLTAVSLAFTFGTVRVAERILGNSDYRRGLTFVDLGTSDQPVRTSRYELLFTSTQKSLETRYQDALYIGIDDRIPRMPGEPTFNGYYAAPISAEEEKAEPKGLGADLPVFRGKLPADYTVSQQLRQWSPLVSRQTTFGGQTGAPDWDWKAIGALPWRLPTGRASLVKAVRAVEPGAHVLLFWGSRIIDPAQEFADEITFTYNPHATHTGWAELNNSPPGNGAGTLPVSTVRPGGEITSLDGQLLALIQRACTGPNRGLFAIVSQTGTTGGDGFEDLALLDPSDPRQWLLVVVAPRDGEWLIFRKLYRGGAG